MKQSGKAVLLMTDIWIAGVFLFGACSQPPSGDKNAATAPSSNTVRVKADLSLKPAFFELTGYFEQENSARVQVVYAPSLEIQPDGAGDSVDIYLLANNGYLAAPAHPDSLARVVLAYAIPCIVVPDLNPALVTDLKFLQQSKMLIGIADPARDILGRFAVEILKKNGLYDNLAPRLIQIGPSALELADAVARGEVDAALGWTVFPNWTSGSTDVILLNGVEIPRIAAISAWRAINPVDSTNASRMMNFLQSERSLNCFRKYGYLILDSDLASYAPVAQVGGMPGN